MEGVAGVCGVRPRLLACGGIQVVVSDYEGETVRIEREQVFAHERVVRRVLESVTPLPFRFGTLAGAEKLEKFVETNREALLNNLERVRNCVEMSVKIIWDVDKVRRQARAASEREGEAGEPKASGEGASYLEARRREILGGELLKERAQEVAEWLKECLAGEAVEHELEVRPSEPLVVRAAFLVRRERLKDYQARVEEARASRADLRFLTSGAWPPYSFSNINP